MKPIRGIRPIDLMLLAAIVGYAGWKGLHRPHTASKPAGFSEQVDLEPLHRVAVQADGRVRSYESHAKTFMGFVTGPRYLDGQTHGFTYLDMLFRPELYQQRDCVYVKNKQVRAQILQALKDQPQVDAARATAVLQSGLVAPSLLMEPKVRVLLQRLGEDVIRTAKVVDAIQSALSVTQPDLLAGNLRVVAPPDGNVKTPWISIPQLSGAGAPADERHAGLRNITPIAGLPEGFQGKVRDLWLGLRAAWRAEDAPKVNEAVSELAGLFPQVSPGLYPSPGRLSMESWYFRNKSMTWVWWLYAAAVVPLLMSVIYHWAWARTTGMILYVVALLGHTASLGIRWYISGRWPNSNMFEAVHTSAWLGTVVALGLECITRRTPVRNLFALGSSVMSMAALMAAYFLPAQLDSSINNKMAALNDVWLYIHTNMIILAYALIGLAFVTALLLLRHRWCAAWDNGTIPKLRLLLMPIELVVANTTGYMMLMHVIDPANRRLPGSLLVATVGAFTGATLLLAFELLGRRLRTTSVSSVERSASGGASSLILGMSSQHPFLKEKGPSLTEVLDGATMVLLELSFITLWTGIVMGAIWADHSWGRPWGWDPKEVFALNTFIIFLILVHVRLKVRDKAFWTAVLAAAGFEVMMFNWIVVNFIISGLHSYA